MVLVYVDAGGTIVGTVLTPSHHVDFDTQAQGNTASFGSLAVLPHAQGRGVASLLVRAVEERASADGKTRMECCFGHGELFSGKPNLSAFYRSLGYTAGERKNREEWFAVLPAYREGLFFQQMVKLLL